MIWDGISDVVFFGIVVVDGNWIFVVIKGINLFLGLFDNWIDGIGMIFMFGMVEGYCYFSFMGIFELIEFGQLCFE